MDADERKIRDLVETWFSASTRGDIDTVLGLMSDDVVFTVVGQKPFGKKEFVQGSRAMAGKTTFAGAYDIQEIKLLGDWAWMRNQITVTATPPGGAPKRMSGYTLSILRKQPAGNWVIVRDANAMTPEA